MKTKSALFLMLLFLSGCSIVRKPCSADSGTASYLRQGFNFSRLGTVILLEPYSTVGSPEFSAEFTEALSSELKKKQVFSLDILLREDPQWQNLQLGQAQVLDLDEIVKIKNCYASNAVIYGTITHYQPFPRMAVGLKLTMLDMRSGNVLWGIEQVWDSTDKAVEKRMQQFYQNCLSKDYDPLEYRLMKVSPRAFVKFVTGEIAMTIPSGCGNRW